MLEKYSTKFSSVMDLHYNLYNKEKDSPSYILIKSEYYKILSLFYLAIKKHNRTIQ